ncbi:CatA-like O-acetyltransferase [Fictibacillus sp. NRS-1165]
MGQEGKVLLPISIQMHHAVCDGYNANRLLHLNCNHIIHNIPL